MLQYAIQIYIYFTLHAYNNNQSVVKHYVPYEKFHHLFLVYRHLVTFMSCMCIWLQFCR